MNKDDVRARILQEAGAIFAAEGFQNATVRRICTAANVNVAAINYYFGDKENLYVAAVTNARNLIERRWPLPQWTDDVTAEQRLRVFIQTFLRRLLSSQTEEWQTRLLLREIIEPTRACEELVRDGFGPFYSVLRNTLRKLLGDATPEPVLHRFGFSIIGQCVFYLAHRGIVEMMLPVDERREYFQADQLAEHIFQFSVAAIERFRNGEELDELSDSYSVAGVEAGRREHREEPGS